ncbi:hypothetical protein E5K00_01310 [Hymenobacter aquaticus]|uniref:Uncharacterized protein n=1 Tax=Hymenobacter aquaticus TaxID=1867101 RepID=A0A4Z0Q5C4_9BACT|nr:hypothetical protein [Hymenobacter aquaticus]TGE23882.1 hypothetical protein E5K00_01310 [Hymenobacter aquaticus]
MPTPLFPDLSSTAQRRRFTRLFGARLAADALLGSWFGPVAPAAAGAEAAWWELALTGNSYCGRPSRPSLPDAPLMPALLARWCQLLDDTMTENFAGPRAQAARAGLRNLATMRTHWLLTHQRQSAAPQAPATRSGSTRMAA